MSEQLAVTEHVGTERWSREQIDLVKNLIAPNSTDAELQLFEMVCRRTRLDPFTGQIRALKRRVKNGNEWEERLSVQTGIDGFRLIAERTGKYRGQIGPMWCGKDGVWREVWLTEDEPPSAAKIGILRDGFTEPVWSVARWGAYAQTKADGQLTRMWAMMGDFMLAKCAESLGLRKAFPQELSGLYTDDEMGQADRGQTDQTRPPANPRVETAEPPKEKPKPKKVDPKTLPAEARHEAARDWWAKVKFQSSPTDEGDTFAIRFAKRINDLHEHHPEFCTAPSGYPDVREYVREITGMSEMQEFTDLASDQIAKAALHVADWLKMCKPTK